MIPCQRLLNRTILRKSWIILQLVISYTKITTNKNKIFLLKNRQYQMVLTV